MPIDLQGSYYTLVRTDVDNNVFEGVENNNDRSALSNSTISLAPTPDLVIDSVDAASTGVSGQNLEVNWTVRNAGSQATGNWNDSFYLSRDQVFDRSTDTYLGFSSYTSNLAAGATYNKTQSFRIPQGVSGLFYVFAVTDASNTIYERNGENNNVAYDVNSIAVSLSRPADLVVGTITIPATGVVGQNASITYTVTNQGANPVQGNWADSLYLSKDNQWDINDTFLGQVQNSGQVIGGGSYTKTLTSPLAGVVQGDYHVILRTDIRNQVPESNEANNLKATLDLVNIDLPSLTLGTPSMGTLGQAVYYRVDVGAGETLLVSLDSELETSINELYVSFGNTPTRSQFDFGFNKPLSPDQEVVVPFTQAGTYYILAFNEGVGNIEPDFKIVAEVLDFEIRSLSTNTGGNAGNITLEISGAKFDTDIILSLKDDNGNEFAATRIDVIDQTKLFATFNLRGLTAGLYDVVATNSSNESIALEDSFTVVEGGSADVITKILFPAAARPNTIIPMFIQFANNGNIDITSPLARLVSELGAPIAFNPEDLANQATSLDFILQDSDDVFGILAPGATGSIIVYTQAVRGLDFSLSVLDDADTALNWDNFIANTQAQSPELLDDPEFAARYWSTFRENIGETVGDIQSNSFCK